MLDLVQIILKVIGLPGPMKGCVQKNMLFMSCSCVVWERRCTCTSQFRLQTCPYHSLPHIFLLLSAASNATKAASASGGTSFFLLTGLLWNSPATARAAAATSASGSVVRAVRAALNLSRRSVSSGITNVDRSVGIKGHTLHMYQNTSTSSSKG